MRGKQAGGKQYNAGKVRSSPKDSTEVEKGALATMTKGQETGKLQQCLFQKTTGNTWTS
jgi:hypothetical protein